jgi:type I restriction enzyme R subunit
LEKIHADLKKEKQSFEAMGISYNEKAFYDILVAVAEKYEFKDSFTDEQFIHIAKEIKKLVSNKSKYTD